MMQKRVSHARILEPMEHKRDKKRLFEMLSDLKDVDYPEIGKVDRHLNRQVERVFGLIYDISRVKKRAFDKECIRRFYYYAAKSNINTACFINAEAMLSYRLYLELSQVERAKDIFENASLDNINDFSKSLVEKDESTAKRYLQDAFGYTMQKSTKDGVDSYEKNMDKIMKEFKRFRDIVNSPAYAIEDSPAFGTPKRYGTWISLENTKRFEGDMNRFGIEQEEYDCCCMLDDELSKKLRMQTLKHISQVNYSPVGFFVKRDDRGRTFRFVCLEIDLIKDGDILKKTKMLKGIGLPVQIPLGYRYIKGRLVAGLSYIRGEDLKTLIGRKFRNEYEIFEKIGYITQKAHMNGILFGDLATRNIIIADQETLVPKIHFIDYEHVCINGDKTPFSQEQRKEDLQILYSELTRSQRIAFENGRKRFEKRNIL
jgi:tRNA A-37 threonylcarbamoyl transferase component Bud32